MKDPALRAATLYNRGNAALEAKDLQRAISDYTSALRLAPADRDAKRNLEIALRRQQAARQQQQQQQGGGGSSPRQQPRPGPQQPQAGQGQGQQPQAGDLEALLRSIEQQEREELQRMRRGKGEQRRVGW